MMHPGLPQPLRSISFNASITRNLSLCTLIANPTGSLPYRSSIPATYRSPCSVAMTVVSLTIFLSGASTLKSLSIRLSAIGSSWSESVVQTNLLHVLEKRAHSCMILSTRLWLTRFLRPLFRITVTFLDPYDPLEALYMSYISFVILRSSFSFSVSGPSTRLRHL